MAKIKRIGHKKARSPASVVATERRPRPGTYTEQIAPNVFVTHVKPRPEPKGVVYPDRLLPLFCE